MEKYGQGNRPSQGEVLRRNLAAAFIATQAVIGPDYARRKHAHEAVGEFWISLARMVLEHLAQHPAIATANSSHYSVTQARWNGANTELALTVRGEHIAC